MGVGAGLYMYDVVGKTFTFAFSSTDEFLFCIYSTYIYSSITCPDKLSSSITCLDSGRIVEVDLYMKVGSVCPSVCTTVSSSINPLPSDRLRCYDRYIHRIIRCQRSLAVKTLNSRPAMSGPHLTREVCVE